LIVAGVAISGFVVMALMLRLGDLSEERREAETSEGDLGGLDVRRERFALDYLVMAEQGGEASQSKQDDA
jgi:hypothetical protein